MERVLVFDRNGSWLLELNESEVFGLTRYEEVNGEHSLTIETTRRLEIGQRILTQDATGKWREYSVYGIEDTHDSTVPLAVYYCVWTLQTDLMGTHVSAMPGVQTPVNAATALASVVSGTSRWTVGTVTNGNTGGASMYDTDGWTALSTFVETWGGEIDVTITVDMKSGVTARAIDNKPAIGEQTAQRRFDFGADIKSVQRTIADTPLYCRISPRGKGELNDNGTYGRRITIESVNGGLDYLQNDDVVDYVKLPSGNSYEYPTEIVVNEEIETPADLKAWAQSILVEHTTPQVTYDVDVLQVAREGVDMQGVSLGDKVQVVDRKFWGGIRLEERVIAMTVDELTGKTSQVKLGAVQQDFADIFSSISKRVDNLDYAVGSIASGTSAYIESLLERLNEEINATGGYTYIVEGNGIRTYNAAVSDPLVGAEASAVVEIKGGTIRIANTKTAQGAWVWKTVFTSGHVAANLVTAAQITTGYIGSSGSTFIDLDNDIIQLGDQSGVWTNITSDAFDIREGATTVMAHFGYGEGTAQSGTANAPYFTLGERESGSTVGNWSTAEGMRATASGYASHAEGTVNTARGQASHAEGSGNIATNEASHAEGFNNTASGTYSHVEGSSCTASGYDSHAEGQGTEASGIYSHAQNQGTVAASDHQTALGKYNVSDSGDNYAVIIGNGRSNARSNALTVKWDGSVAHGGVHYLESSNIDRDGSNPSSDTYADSYIVMQDSGGERIGEVRVNETSDGTMRLRLNVFNESNSTEQHNTLQMAVAKDGTCSYSVTDPAAFRNALGLNTWSSVTTTDWVTPSSGWSVTNTSVEYNAALKAVRVKLQLNATSAHSAGNSTIATVASDYRPSFRAVLPSLASNSQAAYFDSGGSMTANISSVASGSSVYYAGVYYL